jgi:hypothetical protein
MSTWGHGVVDNAIVDTIIDGSLQYIDPRNPRVFLGRTLTFLSFKIERFPISE